MELNRNNKVKYDNTCIKDVNMNCVNIFDSNLKSRRNNEDGFKLATKLKRNFK